MASSASELSWREVSWNGNFRDSQLQQEFQNFLHSQRSTLFLLVLLIGYALPDSFQDLTVTSSSLTEGVKAWLVAVLVLTGSFLCFTDWQKSKVPTPLTSTMLVFIHTSILLFMTSLLQLIAYLRSKEEDTVLASANVVRMDTLRIVKELFLVSATPVLLFMAYPDLSFHHYLMVLITSMVLVLLWMAWNRIDLMVWTCVWCLTLLSTLCYQRYQNMQFFFTVLQLTRALQEHEHHSNTSISEGASNNSNGNGNRAAGSRDAMHLPLQSAIINASLLNDLTQRSAPIVDGRDFQDELQYCNSMVQSTTQFLRISVDNLPNDGEAAEESHRNMTTEISEFVLQECVDFAIACSKCIVSDLDDIAVTFVPPLTKLLKVKSHKEVIQDGLTYMLSTTVQLLRCNKLVLRVEHCRVDNEEETRLRFAVVLDSTLVTHFVQSHLRTIWTTNRLLLNTFQRVEVKYGFEESNNNQALIWFDLPYHTLVVATVLLNKRSTTRVLNHASIKAAPRNKRHATHHKSSLQCVLISHNSSSYKLLKLLLLSHSSQSHPRTYKLDLWSDSVDDLLAHRICMDGLQEVDLLFVDASEDMLPCLAAIMAIKASQPSLAHVHIIVLVAQQHGKLYDSITAMEVDLIVGKPLQREVLDQLLAQV